jgi:hypothetical protein
MLRDEDQRAGTSKSTREGRSMLNSAPDAKTLPDKSDDLPPALADLVIH